LQTVFGRIRPGAILSRLQRQELTTTTSNQQRRLATMATTEKLSIVRKIGEFLVESLGVESSDYFGGYGLGPKSPYSFCAYGIGDTVSEALDDCLEIAAQQGFDIDEESEERIRAELSDCDDSTTVAEYLDCEDSGDFYFHVGIKWSSAAAQRLERIRKLEGIEFLEYESYEKIDNSTSYGRWGYVRRADGDVSYGDLKSADCPDSADDYLDALCVDCEEPGEVYFYVPFASGSDFSGSTVSKANSNSFVESFGENEFVFSAHGGYSTYAVCVGLTGLLTCDDCTFDAICETIEGLADYPVIDEESLSRLESETTNEEWEGWASADFRKALERKFEGVDFSFPADDAFRSFFEDKRDKANCYWEAEGSGCSMHVDISRVVDKIEFDDVSKWAVCYKLTYLDVGTTWEDYFSETEVIDRIAELEAQGILYAYYVVIEPATDD
jgi:hypothetical protein